MKKRIVVGVCLFFGTMLAVLLGCEGNKDTDFTTEFFITVRDEQGKTVSGANTDAINFYVFNSVEDYDEAFRTKDYSRSYKTVNSTNSLSLLSLPNPNPELFVLIMFKDRTRNLNMSSFGVSGLLRRVQKRAKIYISLNVRPIDGNLVFYSTATNSMPIEVKVSPYDSISGPSVDKKVIVSSFTGSGIPGYDQDNISAVWYNKDPGKYAYYAKSKDGCVWTGVLVIGKGEQAVVNLSKCPVGKVAFYTDATNATLMPISVTINGQNLIATETNSLAASTNVSSFGCSSLASSELLIFSRDAGKYSYYASSADGTCVWTGAVDLATDECKFIKLNTCIDP